MVCFPLFQNGGRSVTSACLHLYTSMLLVHATYFSHATYFMTDKENIEEKKELLFTIWKIRQHEIKRIQIN